jgi:hypothetical protein
MRPTRPRLRNEVQNFCLVRGLFRAAFVLVYSIRGSEDIIERMQSTKRISPGGNDFLCYVLPIGRVDARTARSDSI